LEGATDWQTVHQQCIAKRGQPLSPGAFLNEIKKKTFTNGADLEVVHKLYTDVFSVVFSQVEELDFTRLGWDNVDTLCETLKDAARFTDGASCPHLKVLWLYDNPIADLVSTKAKLAEVLGDSVDIVLDHADLMREKAWTGSNDVEQESYKVGETAWAVNPYYVDGTRLRNGPEREAEFNGQSVLNDAEVVVLEVQGDFAKVRTLATEGEVAEGWLRQRNLTRNKSEGARGGGPIVTTRRP
jgi:hypothetical protein